MTLSAVFRRWALPVLGLALVVVGVALASQPASYGWFGAPDGAFIRFPAPYVVMPTIAAVALIAGVALVGGWAGFRLASRPRRDGVDS